MSNTPAPAPDSPAPQSSVPDANAIANAAASALDGHGHNPADYDWVLVLKKRRKDGWLPDKQRRFIEHLADHGSVKMAALSYEHLRHNQGQFSN